MITRSFADTFLQRVDVISDVFVVTKSCQEITASRRHQ